MKTFLRAVLLPISILLLAPPAPASASTLYCVEPFVDPTGTTDVRTPQACVYGP